MNVFPESSVDGAIEAASMAIYVQLESARKALADLDISYERV
jgi:hypothetical protein